MKTVHHRTFKYVDQWEFDSAQGKIHLVIQMGARLFEPEPVKVCSALRPRIGAFVISRQSAGLDVWVLHSASFDRDLDYSRACRIHPDIAPIDLSLVGCPDRIGVELLEL